MRLTWDRDDLGWAFRVNLLPTWSTSAGEPDTVFALKAGSDSTADLYQDGDLLQGNIPLRRLAWEIRRWVHLDVATFSPHYVFVHAGVVLTCSGLLVLPGKSHAGKSTLVKTLVDAGAKYYSDEYAVVGENGRILSFPRALHLRFPRVRHYLARRLGWNPESFGLPPTAIVATYFEPGATWRPRPIGRRQLFECLLANTVSARTDFTRASRYLREVCSHTKLASSGPRGECRESVSSILEWLRTDPLH